MIAAMPDGCQIGVGVLVACAAMLFVVATWPAYVMGLLRVPEETLMHARRAVTMTSLLLLALAGAGALFVALDGC
jgi:hypothetical protein